MHLNKEPFEKIRNRYKTIELRLNDEKRRKISVGDVVKFSCKEYPSVILVAKVVCLHAFKDFEELYYALPLEKCGYAPEEVKTATPEDMKKYYSEDAVSKWGTLGIEIEFLGVRDKDIIRPSRFISLVLRHKPTAAGITVDEHGWADVRGLLEGVSRKHPIDFETLEEIVYFDNKGRYSFNKDKTKIRANQGHSIPVDVELEKTEPPTLLYHGTGEKYTGSIEREGLIPKTRLYVHLSSDVETAVTVGKRHGKPVVYAVDSAQMAKDGFEFFLSVNKVWLTKQVPAKYLKRV